MLKSMSGRATSRPVYSLQPYVLMLLGVICLLGAVLLRLNPFAYPVGLLFLGLGMLIAVAFNPYRLAIGGILVTLIGGAIFIAFKPIIPYSDGLLIIAIGSGLLGIAFMARRGYVGVGATTPAIIIIIVGLVEYGPTARFLPANFGATVLSLWFPGVVLLLLGLTYFLLDRSKQRASVREKSKKEILPQE
ncbi:MAG: hypothetical protein NVS2B12_42690 [Ktedonobacteraceae bacterium]